MVSAILSPLSWCLRGVGFASVEPNGADYCQPIVNIWPSWEVVPAGEPPGATIRIISALRAKKRERHAHQFGSF
jgi:hypothetical protein